MKKLLVAVAFFAVAGASAQTKAAQPKAVTTQSAVAVSAHDAKAQKNVDDLAALVTLTPQQKSDMKQLFITKFRMLTENGELSSERKEYISTVIGRKLQASFDADTFAKIKANTALFQSLTH